jgi:hypothetical protein
LDVWTFDVYSDDLISSSLEKSRNASASLSMTGKSDFRFLGPI